MTDNRIFNGSFEKELKGWTLFDDVSGKRDGVHIDGGVSGSGVYADGDPSVQAWDDNFGFSYATATDGTHSFWNPFDGAGPGVITLSQDVSLANSASDVLHFDFQAAWNLVDFADGKGQPQTFAPENREFEVEVRDHTTGKVFDFHVLTAKGLTINDGSHLHQVALDLSRFAGDDITLQFRWLVPESFTGPASFTLDNIQLNANEQFGGKEGELLKGSGFADDLIGNGGGDTLRGGLGADVLTGGHGQDVFLYRSLHESFQGKFGVAAPGGIDLITDLQARDVIDISAIDADHHQKGDQAFRIVSDFDGGRGEARLSYDAKAGQTSLELDVNGDGTADMVIHMSGDQTGFTNFVL